MKVAVYVKKRSLQGDERVTSLVEKLREGGIEVVMMGREDPLADGLDMLVCVGGDGTFLSASAFASRAGIPLLGVNMGRLGFLNQYTAQEVTEPLIRGEYEIEERKMLCAKVVADGKELIFNALNEVTVHRTGAAVLGVDCMVGAQQLPTYWADGLLVATSSGSTAYSLSVGGPICLPEADVLIISPIAPHNLNLRPLIVPVGTRIGLRMHSRGDGVMFTCDNRNIVIPPDATIDISMAQFSLKRVRLPKSNFIQALKDKLFWGEDVRNMQ